MDAAAAGGGGGTPSRGRNYYRPGLRAPSPTMQKRLEAMHHNNPLSSFEQPPHPSPHHQPSPSRYGARTPTLESIPPSPGMGGGSAAAGGAPPPPPKGPSSTGLIRITLKKPMGIVFEPMEDPHNPSQQRGVRICDLPRTGAAAMSGQLKVGDELLSINDKTMSRLTFDEIMDFIIAAAAEQIKLLFRRPKKERSSGKRGEMEKGTSVKWMDVDPDEKTKKRGKKKKVYPKEAEEGPFSDDDNTMGEETMGEETMGEDTMGDDTFYTEETEETRRRRRNGHGRKDRRYRNETFLDMLIDSICAPMMGDMGKKRRDDDSFDDDGTFNSADDDTYATFESYERRKNKRGGGGSKHDKSKQSTKKKESKKREESPPRGRKNGGRPRSPPPPPQDSQDMFGAAQDFDDENDHSAIGQSRSDTFDGNGLNQDSMHSAVESKLNSTSRETQESPSAFGLNPPSQETELKPTSRFEPQVDHVLDEPEEVLETDPNIPISELEYDHDHGADVSVMESVGGPSLLLENMRMKEAMKASRKQVSPDIIEYYGLEYPAELGLTREETIRLNPDKFYRYIVKDFLEAYEPEKVRLLDKLFTKYKGREEHLIQKLNSRYGDDHRSKIDEKAAAHIQEPIQEEPQQDDGFQQFGDFPQEHSSRDESKTETRFNSGSIDDNRNSQDEPIQGANISRNDKQGNKNAFNQGWLEDDEEEEEEGDDGSDRYRRNSGSHVDARDENDAGSHSSYSDSEYDSVDGTSPAVIAQVSELLNYVYGKTSVPGQIDRVSTIMRAYEGREGVLLELLETKAVIKAEEENENAENLPERLRKNPALQNNGQVDVSRQDMISPVSNMTGSMFDNTTTTGSVEQSIVPSKEPVSGLSKFSILPYIIILTL